MSKITHIMLDLETLGNRTTPALMQIAAIPFDLTTGEVFSNTFNMLIDPTSCVKNKLDIDGDTVSFWLKQDKTIIEKILINSIVLGLPIETVLEEFTKWLKQFDEDIRLWGNGLMSDNRWLLSAFEKCNVKDPIRHWQHSDVRTLVDLGIFILGEDIKSNTEFVGEKHDAIDDCKHQIKYICEIFKRLKEI